MFIEASSKEVVDKFVKKDPLIRAGHVLTYEVQPIELETKKSIEDFNKLYKYRPG